MQVNRKVWCIHTYKTFPFCSSLFFYFPTSWDSYYKFSLFCFCSSLKVCISTLKCCKADTYMLYIYCRYNIKRILLFFFFFLKLLFSISYPCECVTVTKNFLYVFLKCRGISKHYFVSCLYLFPVFKILESICQSIHVKLSE